MEDERDGSMTVVHSSRAGMPLSMGVTSVGLYCHTILRHSGRAGMPLSIEDPAVMLLLSFILHQNQSANGTFDNN